MMICIRRWIVLACLAVLAGCGGDSFSSWPSGPGLDNLGYSPPVAIPFVQLANNLQVKVEDGPRGFSLAPNANILYATVTVCVPGGSPSNPAECQRIDHVQVDTGSVGLRVLASAVKQLNLPPVKLSADGDPVTLHAWECFPFVIGGLWGANAGADVWLGQQVATRVPVHLIEDDPKAALQAPSDCVKAADGNVLDSAGALGSNGILGIGSTTLDCGLGCESGNYAGSFVQYYSCPPTASSSAACSAVAMPAALQVYNPVAALPAAYNNGVVLRMPAVTDPGASTASGELVFGLNTQANNTVPGDASKVFLGVDYVNRLDSYLNVTTRFNNKTYVSSYLDTGTNGQFFTDAALPLCTGGTWYCPNNAMNVSAVLSDGDYPQLHEAAVAFQIGNAETLFSTNNTAFQSLAGAAPAGSTTFAWGMPFFYGRQVFLSIWQQAGSLDGPWYAWTAL
jgi:Protein of unknown function (DUF3443)